MSLRARIDKLEPRERRLLGILAVIFGAFIFLLVPIGIASMLSSKRTANDDVRALIEQIYDQRHEIAAKKAKHDALLARYKNPAPPLAGYLEQLAADEGLQGAESQDRPELAHGKRYVERMTVIKMHKANMLALAKMFEKIEQSGKPVSISKLNLKPRAGEPDSYEVELGLSAFDRKADEPKANAAAAPSASASASPKEEAP